MARTAPSRTRGDACGDESRTRGAVAPAECLCVFFDADRVSAPTQLAALLGALSPDALLLYDNALSHPAEIADYLSMVDRLPDFVHSVVPIGKGLSMAYRDAGARVLQGGPLGK